MAKRRNRKRKKKGNCGTLNGIGSWAEEHPFLTFLLASSAISAVYGVASSLINKNK